MPIESATPAVVIPKCRSAVRIGFERARLQPCRSASYCHCGFGRWGRAIFRTSVRCRERGPL